MADAVRRRSALASARPLVLALVLVPERGGGEGQQEGEKRNDNNHNDKKNNNNTKRGPGLRPGRVFGPCAYFCVIVTSYGGAFIIYWLCGVRCVLCVVIEMWPDPTGRAFFFVGRCWLYCFFLSWSGPLAGYGWVYIRCAKYQVVLAHFLKWPAAVIVVTKEPDM